MPAETRSCAQDAARRFGVPHGTARLGRDGPGLPPPRFDRPGMFKPTDVFEEVRSGRLNDGPARAEALE